MRPLRSMRELFQVASPDDLLRYRAMLPYLEDSVTMMGEDGIRYTFCAPMNAEGAASFGLHRINFHTTMRSNGAKNFKRGALQKLEHYVYERERARIIREILANFDHVVPIPRLKGHPKNAVEPYPEDFGDGFIDDMRHAIDRTNELRGLRFPKLQGNARLEVRRIRGVWWLLHRAWMPLCFDTFEEAVKFANQYIVRKRTGSEPRRMPALS